MLFPPSLRCYSRDLLALLSAQRVGPSPTTLWAASTTARDRRRILSLFLSRQTTIINLANRYVDNHLAELARGRAGASFSCGRPWFNMALALLPAGLDAVDRNAHGLHVSEAAQTWYVRNGF